MTPKEDANKLITGCCAVAMCEMVKMEMEHRKRWERQPKKGKRPFKPMYDVAFVAALFEDLGMTALDLKGRVQ